MRRTLFYAAAVLLLGAGALAGDDPTESLPGVVDLTVENFDKIVNGGKHVLVEFYAPWCGHCKRMTPEYKKLGELVKADPALAGRVVIGKVNADNHRELGERFGVQGFPTIRFFPRGKAPNKDTALDYASARTAEKFMEYLKKQLEADKGFARVEELNELAASFKSHSDKAALAKEVAEKVSGLEGEAKSNGELYVKLIEKAVEKGDEYLAKEKARVEKMIATGSVAAAKVEEMARKASVIGHLLDEE